MTHEDTDKTVSLTLIFFYRQLFTVSVTSLCITPSACLCILIQAGLISLVNTLLHWVIWATQNEKYSFSEQYFYILYTELLFTVNL